MKIIIPLAALTGVEFGLAASLVIRLLRPEITFSLTWQVAVLVALGVTSTFMAGYVMLKEIKS
ncbi:MAG: hypothetical protein AAB610_03465 [Patescibacteria group bacterium]